MSNFKIQIEEDIKEYQSNYPQGFNPSKPNIRINEASAHADMMHSLYSHEAFTLQIRSEAHSYFDIWRSHAS